MTRQSTPLESFERERIIDILIVNIFGGIAFFFIGSVLLAFLITSPTSFWTSAGGVLVTIYCLFFFIWGTLMFLNMRRRKQRDDERRAAIKAGMEEEARKKAQAKE